MSEAKIHIACIVNNMLKKLINNNLQQHDALKKAYAKSDHYIQMAYNLGCWKKEYLNTNPGLNHLLRKEVQQLRESFSEKQVIMYFDLKKEYKKPHCHYEILAIGFGLFMVYFGITDEINHVVSVTETPEFLTHVQTGALTAFYGILVLLCGIISIVYKLRKQ